MREPTFWILTSLASEPRHGYGIIQETARLCDGRIKLQPGTLYAALDRLTAQGLVEADHEEIIDGRTRYYYRLTGRGVLALEHETQWLRHSAEVAAGQLATRRRLAAGLLGKGSVNGPAVGPAAGPATAQRIAW